MVQQKQLMQPRMDVMRSTMAQQDQLMQPHMDMMRSNMGQREQLLQQPRMEMLADRQMALRMSPMQTMYRDQTMAPNQYFLKDKMGNYVYAYATQNSEKKEEGDMHSVKGHYAYIMSNGQKRRVDYIANDQGFFVIRDDADNSRIKRSVEPDLIQTKMTSYMDSSSLRDDTMDMYRRMSPKNMYRNRMGMMDNQNMGRKMYLSNDMSSNIMGRNMMHQDMSSNMMNKNMMGQDMTNSMMYNNMMGQDMHSNMNMIGRGMNQMNSYANNQMMGQDMHSNVNMMGQGMNQMNSYANNQMMGQNLNMMGQRMEIEQIPSNRFF